MDSDCLIKLTKSGLKELVCSHCAVTIPSVVEVEIVDSGKAKGCADAYVVDDNVKKGTVKVLTSPIDVIDGDHALVKQYSNTQFDAVATDDAKLTRRLTANGIPFILPGLLIYRLFRENRIDKKSMLGALRQLSPLISRDEYSTVILLLEGTK
ncbi:MAG: hypothetical protein GY866_08220 [Proteobacteria bacterium]|nr:hypothetical protein [Pseudomonadota bacterium]